MANRCEKIKCMYLNYAVKNAPCEHCVGDPTEAMARKQKADQLYTERLMMKRLGFVAPVNEAPRVTGQEIRINMALSDAGLKSRCAGVIHDSARIEGPRHEFDKVMEIVEDLRLRRLQAEVEMHNNMRTTNALKPADEPPPPVKRGIRDAKVGDRVVLRADWESQPKRSYRTVESFWCENLEPRRVYTIDGFTEAGSVKVKGDTLVFNLMCFEYADAPVCKCANPSRGVDVSGHNG